MKLQKILICAITLSIALPLKGFAGSNSSNSCTDPNLNKAISLLERNYRSDQAQLEAAEYAIKNSGYVVNYAKSHSIISSVLAGAGATILTRGLIASVWTRAGYPGVLEVLQTTPALRFLLSVKNAGSAVTGPQAMATPFVMLYTLGATSLKGFLVGTANYTTYAGATLAGLAVGVGSTVFANGGHAITPDIVKTELNSLKPLDVEKSLFDRAISTKQVFEISQSLVRNITSVNNQVALSFAEQRKESKLNIFGWADVQYADSFVQEAIAHRQVFRNALALEKPAIGQLKSLCARLPKGDDAAGLATDQLLGNVYRGNGLSKIHHAGDE